MEADFEVQIGGGAPVIEALWPGFVDLRLNPRRVAEVSEAGAFPPLAQALLNLNGPASPLWTAKCDLWDPHAAGIDQTGPDQPTSPAHSHAALACYIDLLPRASQVFSNWRDAEDFCRRWVYRLDFPEWDLPDSQVPVFAGPLHDDAPFAAARNATVDLVVRQAIAGEAEGFAVTAYLGVVADYRVGAEEALAAALAQFVAACPPFPTTS